MIDNPAYKGVWKPRDIPNPDYVKDPAPLTNIGKVRLLLGLLLIVGTLVQVNARTRMRCR